MAVKGDFVGGTPSGWDSIALRDDGTRLHAKTRPIPHPVRLSHIVAPEAKQRSFVAALIKSEIETVKGSRMSCDQSLELLRPFLTMGLTMSDKVLVMQGWNKALAFKSSFNEALLIYWRILCCQTEMDSSSQRGLVLSPDGDGLAKPFHTKEASPIEIVEQGNDPLAMCFGDRIGEVEGLLMGLIDRAIRSYCPAHQVVQREAYRPLADDAVLERAKGSEFHLECESRQDHLDLFARMGVRPIFWFNFVNAVVWTMKTHAPYAQSDDLEDLDQAPHKSAFGRAIAESVAVPAIQTYQELVGLHQAPAVLQLQSLWKSSADKTREAFGKTFYRNLLNDYPQLLDYFSRTDRDAMTEHLMMVVDTMVENVNEMGTLGAFRQNLDRLGELHRKLDIPTYSYALFGATILDSFQPLFEEIQNDSTPTIDSVRVEDLKAVLARLYREVMSFVYYPMLRQEKLVSTMKELYEHLKTELNWSEGHHHTRLSDIENQIKETGTYEQTTEELEMAARLAWRNSAKCVGRISWNTLKVRDCRHVNDPATIFQEVKQHLLEATAGTNIQSVMTVFKPRTVREPFGVRFWSSQLLRYAGYEDPISGKVIGDPANVELTNYLIDNELWNPPKNPSRFDILPIVLKVPGRKKPFVYELPDECVFEVDLEHPTNQEISKLGLRWATVPAITNFKMNLGGICYQNMPFNGWFVSTEIVRNLVERYEVGPEVAKAMGVDMATDPMWKDAVSTEVERMVIHSFQKNGYTIVDPMAVGKSFCTHVQREREQFGRECPAQWSWIGGLLGPNNPTWHLEMRDFLVNPQYDYCADDRLLHMEGSKSRFLDDRTVLTETTGQTDSTDSYSEDSSVESQKVPSLLILYGSETGTAEGIARRLKREFRILNPTFMNLNEAKGLGVLSTKSATHVLAVCSTFGKGSSPANATEFFHTKIQEVSPRGVQYAVLALGSSIYPDFCQAGVDLDQILEATGMQQLIQLTKCDEAAGSDSTIESWISMVHQHILPPSLKDYILETSELVDAEPPQHSIVWRKPTERSEKSSQIGSSNMCPCVSNVELAKRNSAMYGKSVRKVTFKAPSSYKSGDHVAILPQNSDALVARFVHCFSTELGKNSQAMHQLLDIRAKDMGSVGPADVFFKTPTTLHTLLKRELDLTLRAKDIPILLDLVKRCLDAKIARQDEATLDLLSSLSMEMTEIAQLQGKIVGMDSSVKTTAIEEFLDLYPTIVSFLEHFQEILLEAFFDETPALPLAEVLVILNRMQPRFYSISSSNKVSPNEISITVGVLNVKTSMGVSIEGVCSNYLARLEGGSGCAQVKVSPSSFRLPAKESSPIIMVGAGTGLAPMMGFLEEKALSKKHGIDVGSIHLFFGCQREELFLYDDTIRMWEREGLITLHLAMSRSRKTPKEYVQDKIEQAGEQVADVLMHPHGHYYVCGDAQMASGCFKACLQQLQIHNVMSRVSASNYLSRMRSEGRWQTDVWGAASHEDEEEKKIRAVKRMSSKIWMSHFQSTEES